MGFPMLTVQRVTDKRLPNETRISLNLQCHSFAQGTQITLLQFLIFSWKRLVLDTSNYMNANTFQTAEPSFMSTHTEITRPITTAVCART